MLRNDQNQNLPAYHHDHCKPLLTLASPDPPQPPTSSYYKLHGSEHLHQTQLGAWWPWRFAGEEQRVRSTYIYLHPWYGNLFSHQRCYTFTDKDGRSLIANSMLGFLEGALGLFSTFILSRLSAGPLL